MTNNELMIAAVMIGGALALRVFLDRRAESRAQQLRMQQANMAAPAVSAPLYGDPYSAFTAAKDRGKAKFLEDGFNYLGALDMAFDLQRLPSPTQPKPVEPTINPPSPAVPN